MVARFRSAAGGSGSGFRATIDCGDGTTWNTDGHGRTSIARSTAIVVRKRWTPHFVGALDGYSGPAAPID